MPLCRIADEQTFFKRRLTEFAILKNVVASCPVLREIKTILMLQKIFISDLDAKLILARAYQCVPTSGYSSDIYDNSFFNLVYSFSLYCAIYRYLVEKGTIDRWGAIS